MAGETFIVEEPADTSPAARNFNICLREELLKSSSGVLVERKAVSNEATGCVGRVLMRCRLHGSPAEKELDGTTRATTTAAITSRAEGFKRLHGLAIIATVPK
jgi:hypothetical protein